MIDCDHGAMLEPINDLTRQMKQGTHFYPLSALLKQRIRIRPALLKT